MAQQVVIAGALFNDVPSISVPDSNSVYHPFVDPSVTTAAASDVAQGKQFIAADGTLTQGTASGGGGTSIVWGKIRGDATLAKSWTYDKLIHADEGVTIPAYSTTNQTLKSGGDLTTESLNFSDYSYKLIFRCLAMPIYSNSTISSGRFIYYAYSGQYDLVFVPASAFSYSGTTAEASTAGAQFTATSFTAYKRILYCTSSTKVRMLDGSYGSYMSTPTATVTVSSSSPYNTATLLVKSPNLILRGNATYLNSTNWGEITDIRYQYIYELWRVPQSATVHGWEIESQLRHIIDCANGNGTLT